MERIILAFAVLVLIGIVPVYAEEIYIITDLGNMFKVEMIPEPSEAEVSEEDLQRLVEEYIRNNQTETTQSELDEQIVNYCIIDLPYDGLWYDVPYTTAFVQTPLNLNSDCTYTGSNLDTGLTDEGFEDRTQEVNSSKIIAYFKIAPIFDEGTNTFTGNYIVNFDKTDGSTSESIIPITFTIRVPITPEPLDGPQECRNEAGWSIVCPSDQPPSTNPDGPADGIVIEPNDRDSPLRKEMRYSSTIGIIHNDDHKNKFTLTKGLGATYVIENKALRYSHVWGDPQRNLDLRIVHEEGPSIPDELLTTQSREALKFYVPDGGLRVYSLPYVGSWDDEELDIQMRLETKGGCDIHFGDSRYTISEYIQPGFSIPRNTNPIIPTFKSMENVSNWDNPIIMSMDLIGNPEYFAVDCRDRGEARVTFFYHWLVWNYPIHIQIPDQSSTSLITSEWRIISKDTRLPDPGVPYTVTTNDRILWSGVTGINNEVKTLHEATNRLVPVIIEYNGKYNYVAWQVPPPFDVNIYSESLIIPQKLIRENDRVIVDKYHQAAYGFDESRSRGGIQYISEWEEIRIESQGISNIKVSISNNGGEKIHIPYLDWYYAYGDLIYVPIVNGYNTIHLSDDGVVTDYSAESTNPSPPIEIPDPPTISPITIPSTTSSTATHVLAVTNVPTGYSFSSATPATNLSDDGVTASGVDSNGDVTITFGLPTVDESTPITGDLNVVYSNGIDDLDAVVSVTITVIPEPTTLPDLLTISDITIPSTSSYTATHVLAVTNVPPGYSFSSARPATNLSDDGVTASGADVNGIVTITFGLPKVGISTPIAGDLKVVYSNGTDDLDVVVPVTGTVVPAPPDPPTISAITIPSTSSSTATHVLAVSNVPHGYSFSSATPATNLSADGVTASGVDSNGTVTITFGLPTVSTSTSITGDLNVVYSNGTDDLDVVVPVTGTVVPEPVSLPDPPEEIPYIPSFESITDDFSNTDSWTFRTYHDGFVSGYQGKTNYLFTKSSGTGNQAPSGLISGDGFVSTSTISRDIDITNLCDNSLYLGIDYRVRSNTSHSTVTNLKIEVFDDSDNTIYSNKAVWGGTRDTGWRSFNVDITRHVANTDSITVSFNSHDSWIANSKQKVNLDNFYLGTTNPISGDANPPNPCSGNANPPNPAPTPEPAPEPTPDPESGDEGTSNPAPDPESGDEGTSNPAPDPESGDEGTSNPAPDPESGDEGTSDPAPDPESGDDGASNPEPTPDPESGDDGTPVDRPGDSVVVIIQITPPPQLPGELPPIENATETGS